MYTKSFIESSTTQNYEDTDMLFGEQMTLFDITEYDRATSNERTHGTTE